MIEALLCVYIYIYTEVVKSSWLWVKENTGGSVHYDFIQHIPLSDSHTYDNGPSVFLSPDKRTQNTRPATRPLWQRLLPNWSQTAFPWDVSSVVERGDSLRGPDLGSKAGGLPISKQMLPIFRSVSCDVCACALSCKKRTSRFNFPQSFCFKASCNSSSRDM